MGTISQLGFMMIVLGWGSIDADIAGAAVLLAHGLFKAAAFMVVGILDHQLGTRDVREIPRPERGWGLTVAVGVLAAASMAGVPILFGFVAKEAAIEALLHSGTGGAIALAAVVVGSIGTAAYSARFALGLLGRLNQHPTETEATPPRLAFVAPAALLTVLTVVLGVRPGLADGLVESSTEALTTVSRTISVHLAVWHGFNTALALSAVALAAGAAVTVLVAGRRREPTWVGPRPPSSWSGDPRPPRPTDRRCGPSTRWPTASRRWPSPGRSRSTSGSSC